MMRKKILNEDACETRNVPLSVASKLLGVDDQTLMLMLLTMRQTKHGHDEN